MDELVVDQLTEIAKYLSNIDKSLTLLVSVVIVSVIICYIYKAWKDIR